MSSSSDGPLLIVSSDFPQFDPDQLQRYRDEGYSVHYIENADVRAFQRVADEIEPGEGYGIIGIPPLLPHPIVWELRIWGLTICSVWKTRVACAQVYE
ncbi:hypothetical protein BGX38DRAFT_1162267 [Terfezia claveryi]|nr:hypothetical protein BGX38DRAFT_1162267 [Terfezia claveryi]